MNKYPICNYKIDRGKRREVALDQPANEYIFKYMYSLKTPTEKQLKLIADMEEFVGEKFHGKTRAEASIWIDEHMEQFKLLTMDNWVLEHGYF